MKWYRYEDPLWQQPPTFDDISGQRFGMLVVVSRKRDRWECVCDCGETTLVRSGDLNRGTTATCGDRIHRRGSASYGRVHGWVTDEKGSASNYSCVDCSGQALHWSYNHKDPDQGVDEIRGPYGTSTEFYEPRCVSCHKNFDLDCIDKARRAK